MRTANKLDFVSVADYLAYDNSVEWRTEYYDGRIVDMAGGSPDHANIAMNVGAELVLGTRGKGCKVYSTDIKIAVDPSRSYLHPDVAVICGEPETSDLRRDMVRNPTLIVEVLSPSTEKRDRGEKFDAYQALESLKEYVLVEQDAPQIYVFTKSSSGDWVYRHYHGLENHVKLQSLGLSIPLANIYYDVKFPPIEEDVPE